jgi:hypothetical protein
MRNRIVTPIVIILIILSFFGYEIYQRKKEVRDLRKQYPEISYDRSIHLTIQEIFNSESLRNSPNYVFVTFSNSEKATIETGFELQTDTLSLDEVLAIGDLIVKEANSNLVLVYKPSDIDSNYKEPFRFTLWQYRNR